MKKLLLASAVAALSVTAAQAAPTVYGKAYLTLDVNTGDTDVTTTVNDAAGKKVDSASGKTSVKEEGRSKLNSNSSRVGFKGKEALTTNTDLVYQLEYGIKIDDNTQKEQFKSRDTYLGLSNAEYGTLVAGRLSAIDGKVDFANVSTGGVLGGNKVQATIDAKRANNSFAYFSPNYNGTQFMAMYVMDENKDTDTFKRDAFGVAVKHETGPMKVGASYLQAGDALKAARVSGSYAVSPVATVGALYQMTDFNTDDNENAFTISGEMKTATPWTAYAQGDVVSNVKGVKDDEKYRVVVGGKYAFNKATTGHIYGAYLNTESKNVESNGHGGKTLTTREYDGLGIGGGIEYKF